MSDLADDLRAAWEAAPSGDRVVTLHLFGIERAAELRNLRLKEPKAIAGRAGISPDSGTELRKAVRLADYVEVKGKPA